MLPAYVLRLDFVVNYVIGGFEQGGGHDVDEEYDDMNVPFTTSNSTGGPNDIMQQLLQSILTILQRVVENTGNNNTILNFLNIAGDPRDYAWGSELDNIISQLMEQQAGRQAPPPAPDEVIENLPKTKISKKQTGWYSHTLTMRKSLFDSNSKIIRGTIGLPAGTIVKEMIKTAMVLVLRETTITIIMDHQRQQDFGSLSALLLMHPPEIDRTTINRIDKMNMKKSTIWIWIQNRWISR
ncbi:2218_t:CDS:2 [Acaulospora colombiana]|uniref:2218_t:CDS:1 n=1 Tax=Acaulospora colombiana TaxID=27376 RepID=A0ACA9KVC6_9GLOM|nr:2218_t:CDS:2 [Acaulospora colombiana]